MATAFFRLTRRVQALIALSLALIFLAGPVWSQPAEQAAPAPDNAREQALAERDRLWKEAQEMGSAGKLQEAAASGEQMLAIEREWLGKDSPKIVGSPKSTKQPRAGLRPRPSGPPRSFGAKHIKASTTGKRSTPGWRWRTCD